MRKKLIILLTCVLIILLALLSFLLVVYFSQPPIHPSIKGKLSEIKNLRETLLIKQKEFEKTRSYYENRIKQVKTELLAKQEELKLNDFEQAITNNQIKNRIANLREYDAYLQEIERRSLGVYQGVDDLLTMERSFKAKSVMIGSISETEVKKFVQQIDSIVVKYTPEVSKLVIDPNLIQMKSEKQIWEDIKADLKNRERRAESEIKQNIIHNERSQEIWRVIYLLLTGIGKALLLIFCSLVAIAIAFIIIGIVLAFTKLEESEATKIALWLAIFFVIVQFIDPGHRKAIFYAFGLKDILSFFGLF